MSQFTPVVFVVDDDISVRESLEALISTEGWRSESFSSAQEFLSHPPTRAPHCLILDVNLPDLNGLELQEKVASDRCCMPIIFITGHGDVPMTVRAMKAGAVEFLTKPLDPSKLLKAIQYAITRSKLALQREMECEAIHACYASLSRREREVMALVVSGLLNKQVGGELGISEVMVKAHRRRAMRKMNAGSLPDLVRMSEQLKSAPTTKE